MDDADAGQELAALRLIHHVSGMIDAAREIGDPETTHAIEMLARQIRDAVVRATGTRLERAIN